MKIIQANLIDVHTRETYGATIEIENQHITKITRDGETYDRFICPGLVDAHVHIESSMLIPSEFARLAVRHGCVATVSDPHEIANVLGVQGVSFMIENGNSVPFKFHWTAPSCVPATSFETSGATLSAADLKPLITHPQVVALGEMMNFPGVIYDDQEVLAKLTVAKKAGKPIDGHIPGIAGEELKKYVAGGITTDHECVSLEEAREKIDLGMKVLIREGSAAKNFMSLHSLITTDTGMVMLCTDDSHPDELLESGNIVKMIKLGLAQGHNVYDLLQCCTLNPVEHYHLDVGLLRVGDKADFIVVDNPDDFNVQQTCINGALVYNGQEVSFARSKTEPVNAFARGPLDLSAIKLRSTSGRVKVIEAIDGELLTTWTTAELPVQNETVVPDPQNDILKVVVLNRYTPDSTPVVGFISGFGLTKGAIATSIAHDSHNIIAVGENDPDIVAAINVIIANKGGITVVQGNMEQTIGLEYGGIMTDQPGAKVASLYQQLNRQVKELGCTLTAPFMTLSFMSLLVIPSLKIGDQGLFDGEKFQFTELFVA